MHAGTVYSVFSSTASHFGDRPFLHIPQVAAKTYSDQSIDLTYTQALTAINRIKTYFETRNLGVGDRVALLLDNRAEFFLHWLALNALGVSIVPLNAEATIDDLLYIVSDCHPNFILSLPERSEIAHRLGIPIVLTTDLSTVPEQQIKTGAPDSQTECALLYTSGSTGKPKGCMLSNSYFLCMGEWYASVGGYVSLRPGVERLLTPLPLVHMNALATSTMGMIMSGGCIIQLDRFHASTWWQSVRDSQATVIHYLGVLPAILLNLPEHLDDRNHSVRFGFGAGINVKHHQAFEDRFGIKLLEAWSMTEVGGAAVVMAIDEPRHVGTSCFGKPADFMEWRLVTDSGEDVKPGTAGEFLVRRKGPDPHAGFFSGYLNRPEETAEVWAGGWFHTGDVIREGPDGNLHFVDRKKSIIRRSGENIASLEVEAVITQLPGVTAVGVAPVPDDIRGEEVFAAIVLDPAFSSDIAHARKIVSSTAETLTYYKIPGYIAFINALPLTASQKLQRGELKSLARALVENGAAFDLRDMKSKSARRTG